MVFFLLLLLLLLLLSLSGVIVFKEEVVGKDYVSLTSKKPGLARGRDFELLSPCYSHFVKLVASQDTAERVCRYMMTNNVY